MTTTTTRRRAPARTGWLVPAGLVGLSLVPVVAGALRLVELGGGERLIGEEGYSPAPGPLATHIVAVTVYAILGAFQFAPRFRARRRAWHRVAGRLVLVCGFLGALSGLWLALFDHRPGISPLLTVFRLVFGTAWAVFLVLGLAAIRRRDIGRHRAWLIRGYAVGLGAGTQAFTYTAWQLAAGEPGPVGEALALLAGWVLNLLVAEWRLHRSRTSRLPEAR
ncbi:MAG: DUF2306 domain-containing protein [Saccharothrix sp.]|nr:DUF2306 domain-containing protein [Saccharothrix sp.]